MGASGGSRTVLVRPPSVRAEVELVARLALPVLVAAGLWLAYQRRSVAAQEELLDGTGASVLSFLNLKAEEQRLVREIQEGVLEAENARGNLGAWPTVEALASEGIAPFAPDPLDLGGYQWQKLQRGLVVNYLGQPKKESERPCFLVVFVESAPGQVVDPRAPLDEVHHRLADGSLVHVTIWRGPPSVDHSQASAVLPAELGWQRITWKP